MGEWLRHEQGKPPSSCGPQSAEDAEWIDRHAALADYMTTDKWPDGRRRDTTTVLLFCEAGVWKACVSDRDSSCVAFVSGAGPTSVLEAVEKGLREGRLDWRPSRKFPKGR